MIVIGGYDGSNVLKSSQIVLLDGSAVKKGPELPEPRSQHCIAHDKENDIFFVTGGTTDFIAKDTVWKFKGKEKFTLNGTSRMKTSRRFHGCRIFRSKKHNGRRVLVTAGSFTSGTGTRTCEFYDYTKAKSQWQLCSKSNSVFLVLIITKCHN